MLLETLQARWWILLFVPLYFWAALGERDLRRAGRFYVISVVAAFGAEYTSTHTGFPYGRYSYIAGTQGEELYVSNIPLFVPLTFGVVVFAGRALAKPGAATRAQLILGGAVAATLLDLVIDPMTLRGAQWFLGPLYLFEANDGWFGVPWSNAAGWMLMSGLIIGMDAALDPAPERPEDRPRVPRADARPRAPGIRASGAARGIALAGGTCAFFVVLAFATRNFAIGVSSLIVAAGTFAIALWPARGAR